MKFQEFENKRIEGKKEFSIPCSLSIDAQKSACAIDASCDDSGKDLMIMSHISKYFGTPSHIEAFEIEIDPTAGKAFFKKYPDFPLFSSSWLSTIEWEEANISINEIMKICLSQIDFISLYDTLDRCFSGMSEEGERQKYIKDIDEADGEVMERLNFLRSKGEAMSLLELEEYARIRLYEQFIISAVSPWQEWEYMTFGLFTGVIQEMGIKAIPIQNK